MDNQELTNQFNELFIWILGIAIVAGILYFFANIFPYLYVNKKGKEIGMDEMTISQWRWKALWIGWLVLIPFSKEVGRLKKSK